MTPRRPPVETEVNMAGVLMEDMGWGKYSAAMAGVSNLQKFGNHDFAVV